MRDIGNPEHNYEAFYQLKEGDIYVEAGAYWGRYGILRASPKVGKNGRVVLIEPSPLNFDRLSKNVKEYLEDKSIPDNFLLVNAALWNKIDGIEFWVDRSQKPEAWTEHRVRSKVDTDVERTNRGETLMVAAYTLDTLLKILTDDSVGSIKLPEERIDLLCWDIEGSANQVFEGCIHSIKAHKIKNMALGFYHSTQETPEWARSILRGHGYTVFNGGEEGFVYAKSETA